MFILDKDLKFVMHPIKAALVGKSLYAVNDPNGNKLGELFASAIRSGGGKGGLPSMWGKTKTLAWWARCLTWGVVWLELGDCHRGVSG